MGAKNNITIHSRPFELYIGEAEIHEAISQVAEQINWDYEQGDFTRPLVLVTLNGGLVFGGELFRQLEGNFELAFVKVASYGSCMDSSGNVQVEVPVTVDVESRDVIIVEDVVDSGNTICALFDLLGRTKAKSIRVATLLLKPEAYTGEIPIDYVALECENRFVIGYGMDYDQAGRNLGAIYALAE